MVDYKYIKAINQGANKKFFNYIFYYIMERNTKN